MIRQLSIFAENKKGAMHQVTRALAEANINMNTLVTNDSAEFGIIRMLVSDTDAALQCMQTAGYLCHVDTVAAAERRFSVCRRRGTCAMWTPWPRRRSGMSVAA